MTLSDDVFPPDDRCEICGAQLDNEIVIQEFADGSLARLCAECAAGAALRDDKYLEQGLSLADLSGASPADPDPMEMTKELLTPVGDLISLQGEMQSALERLAASLERFASGVLVENLDKTAGVEDRVQALEQELERTRARLREAEALLSAAAAGPAGYATDPAKASPASEVEVADGTATSAVPPATTPADISWSALVAPPGATVPEAVPFASPAIPGASGRHEPSHGFRIEEVQAVQRYFNDSPFTGKTRDVRESLGKPQANLTRASGTEPTAFVTIAWDIVWYQYLVDLRRDIPADQRVVLHREGTHLDELTEEFKEKNAIINDDGSLDASELEVKLLSDPSALITEMTLDEEKALEDATEEIWDQRISPEFKWDD